MNKVIHFVASILAFGIPFISMTHSPILDITIGAIINGVYLWASSQVNPTVPVSKI